MNNLDLLQEYLEGNNLEEAKKIIEEALAGDLTENEKAEMYTLIAEIYVKAKNRANEEYLENTAELVQQLKDLESIENEAMESLELLKTRKALE